MLCAGLDMISTVPIERWDIDLYHDPDPSVPGKMPHGSVRQGTWGSDFSCCPFQGFFTEMVKP